MGPGARNGETAMAAGEAAIKQAVKWIEERRAEDPRLDRLTLVDEAARRFDLSPVEADFLLRHLTGRASS
jgi:hypothetical protein